MRLPSWFGIPARIAAALVLIAAGFVAALRPTGAPHGPPPSGEESPCPAGVPAPGGECLTERARENPAEAQHHRFNVEAAPTGRIPVDAFARAVDQRRQVLSLGQSAANARRWALEGMGPLQSADAGYDQVNSLGLAEVAGRITDFAYVPPGDAHQPDTLLASVAYGGVWRSKDQGSHWESIGDSLPSQIVGSVAYTLAGGGTIVAMTGDGSFGRYSREGIGAYYTTDGGGTWNHAAGVPSDTFGFKVAVDGAHPDVVYIATGAGLFRSADAGRSFANVALPTGDCAGRSNRDAGCLLANVVTDVVVQAPGGSASAPGGKVVAAVGWRGGNRQNPDGTVQSPNNGLYESATGEPGTFSKIATVGFAPQERIGRVELGATIGPQQDHSYLYAVVQDAVLIRKGLPGIDVPEAEGSVDWPTIFNGVYSSPDFGHTWLLMADGSELQSPSTGSQLAVIGIAAGALNGTPPIGPGIQSWYNEFIVPDPTRQAGGVPTRVLFGLEEVWMNEATSAPQMGKSSFKVIGRYFSGDTCLLLTVAVPVCPVNREDALAHTTTTHPDQHAAIFIPQPDGGVKAVVGNDGGVYTQTVGASEDFGNAKWGVGANRGFDTLIAYDAARAKDGTVWLGLQDNGTAKIQDVRDDKGNVTERRRVIETFGGDGFFVAVDPNDSNVAYEEYVEAAISATKDGGHTWSALDPPVTNAQFSNPFVMDPLDRDHLMTAGREVVEAASGTGTGASDWIKVFDLGTAKHPGDADAVAAGDDPANAMTALDMVGPYAYAGFCGVCDVLDTAIPFKSGLATNVGGTAPAKRLTSQGWHVAKAIGLPNRYITSIAIDSRNPSTVYVAVGGYSRRWTPPGTLGTPAESGRGHLFKSIDAGEHFTDVSGNLPDTPANWVALRGDQAIVATDVGVFASDPAAACADPGSPDCHSFQVLGAGLPAAPVFTVRVAPWDRNLLTVATWGRGVWTYRFGAPGAPAIVTPPPQPPPPPPAPFQGQTVAGPFDFESDAQGWTARTNNDVEAWRLMPPGHLSTQGFAATPYANESTATLFSPAMTITARSTVRVSWWERVDTELDFDFFSLDWSSDGKVWQTARSVSGNNAGFPDFSQATAEIAAPAGSLFLRFRLTSDQLVSSPPYTGVAIDDVVVQR